MYLPASPRFPKELCLWDALCDTMVYFMLTSGIRDSCWKDMEQHTEKEKAHSEDAERTETVTNKYEGISGPKCPNAFRALAFQLPPQARQPSSPLKMYQLSCPAQ